MNNSIKILKLHNDEEWFFALQFKDDYLLYTPSYSEGVIMACREDAECDSSVSDAYDSIERMEYDVIEEYNPDEKEWIYIASGEYDSIYGTVPGEEEMHINAKTGTVVTTTLNASRFSTWSKVEEEIPIFIYTDGRFVDALG